MKKKILHILKGREKQITREDTVLQPLPHVDFRFANPLIVLHHLGPKVIAPGQTLRIHPHPHRGFSPVTFMLQGEGYHKDSLGNEEILKAGDAQWMFAGKGILHSEGPTERLLLEGGVQELLQLWVNVPKANKFDLPTYQSASSYDQPNVLEQPGVDLKLVSGILDGKTGPLQSITPVISVIGSVAQGKTIQLEVKPGYWTLIYIVKGSACINQETIGQHNQEIILTAEVDTQILFLSAEPINEPIAAKDNFVMNTAEEITQAMADYKAGAFGTLAF